MGKLGEWLASEISDYYSDSAIARKQLTLAPQLASIQLRNAFHRLETYATIESAVRIYGKKQPEDRMYESYFNRASIKVDFIASPVTKYNEYMLEVVLTAHINAKNTNAGMKLVRLKLGREGYGEYQDGLWEFNFQQLYTFGSGHPYKSQIKKLGEIVSGLVLAQENTQIIS